MGGLTSYAWRSLAARPLRSLLTIVGIALGVAVLFAALATNAAIDGAIDRTVATWSAGPTCAIEGFTERGLSAASTEAIDETAGVDGATPILERRTYVAPSVASPPSAEPPPPVTVLGIDPITYALGLHDLDLAAGVGLDRGHRTRSPHHRATGAARRAARRWRARAPGRRRPPCPSRSSGS